jgi:hypothetical protein
MTSFKLQESQVNRAKDSIKRGLTLDRQDVRQTVLPALLRAPYKTGYSWRSSGVGHRRMFSYLLNSLTFGRMLSQQLCGSLSPLFLIALTC